MRLQGKVVQWLGRIPASNLVAGALALVLLAGAAGWLLKPEKHTITISGLDRPMTFLTTQQQLDAALKAEGVTVGAKDQVQPALTTSLKGQREVAVTVRRAVALTVVVGGQEQKVESAAASVGDLLKELNVTLGEKDAVSAALNTPLAAEMQVRVTRRAEQVLTAQEEIPFETVTRDDASLRVGTSVVVQEGTAGAKEVSRRVVIEDGREVTSEVIEETVVKEPVTQIVSYGTMGVVSRGGLEYRYTQELTMTATGYTAGRESNPAGNGLTYTGMRAERGVVAVDPRVIPLYTRLYIEGYGPAIAADTGGAIKGNKIDLCFETVAEALEFGRRPVKVYVLSD